MQYAHQLYNKHVLVVANDMSDDHRYETATISGQATAILGNKYGDVINVHQATFLLQAATTAQAHNEPSKVVRHNQVLPGDPIPGQTTVESIKAYNEGSRFQQRGTVQQTELRWRRCEDIGVGSFGEVHREEAEECGQVKSRAVKVLQRRRLVHMGVDYKKELDAMIELSQPSFVHRFVEFYSWYESHNNIYLAMEYVPFGDLESYIQAGLKESDTRQIAFQVLDGIRIMHELDLIHRDIKPANVFIVQREPVWWVKLGDFSISKRSVTRQTVLQTQVGTQGYQAPEVLGIIETEKKDMYDSKCDIWSFGCLLFEMLTRRLPFPSTRTLIDYCNDEEPFPGLQIKKSGGSLLIAEFVWSMLQASPLARPTAEQATFLLSYRCGPAASSQEGSDGPDFLYLVDCLKRHFRIPWQYCSTWIDIESTLRTMLSYVELGGIGRSVSRGDYELRTIQGICLHSQNWERVVSPGTRVSLSMPSKSHKAVPQHTDPQDDAQCDTKPQSKSHCSLNEVRISGELSGKSSGEQNRAQVHETLIANDSGMNEEPESADIYHETLSE